MRIKIIGDNDCARATRHLLRQAGFAVTEFLPPDAVLHAPHAGYVITIELAPASPPDQPGSPLRSTPAPQPGTALPPREAAADSSAAAASAEAGSPPSSRQGRDYGGQARLAATQGRDYGGQARVPGGQACASAAAPILIDSVDCPLETAVLRHITQLSAAPVVLDRPGGVVHSERELRIVVPLAKAARDTPGGSLADDKTFVSGAEGKRLMDEAAAVAVEFGVLRGLLDLTSPPKSDSPVSAVPRRKKWWQLITVLAATLLTFAAGLPGQRVPGRPTEKAPGLKTRATATGVARLPVQAALPIPSFRGGDCCRIITKAPGLKTRATAFGTLAFVRHRLGPARLAGRPALLAAAQGQFGTSQINLALVGGNATATGGVNGSLGVGGVAGDGAATAGNPVLVAGKGSGNARVPIVCDNWTPINVANTTAAKLITKAANKNIYICSINLVVAASSNVALIAGTQTTNQCDTSTAGLSGGATAATGWNLAANGGLAYGSGIGAIAATATAGLDVCIVQSASTQLSGAISWTQF